MRNSPEPAAVQAKLDKSSPEALKQDAAARRRLLLKGIGKGSALLAATAPLQTLAYQSALTFDGQRCSISGMHSGVGSGSIDPQVCGGYSPGWWGQRALGTSELRPRRQWPTFSEGWGPNTLCVDVFEDCVLQNTDLTLPTLFQIVEPKEPISRFANTDEFHWVCALLNARNNSFGNFPYTHLEVLAFYNSGFGTTVYSNALNFFKTYMEKHVP